ncbi:MAG: PQQ-dependent sugar dehydrogenase [Candidatus Limnocylindrales bacterium]
MVKRWFALVLALLTTAACSPVGAASTASGSASPSASSSASTAASGSAATEPSLVDIGAGLTGQPGLAATVYATGPSNVAAFAFDATGRLWVATAAYTDSGGDAVYLVAGAGAAAIKVGSGLHTVLGLLWIGGELYVAAAGGVTAYGDFDGATFATRRTVVALPAGSGEVNGLVLGTDGRIRLGISAPCDHCTPTTAYSATIVSFLPDGSDLRVEASGIRAPVGLAYLPGTDDLLVSMDQRDDLGSATPGDWLGLVEAGQSWGSPSCYGQGGSACAGVPAPVAVLDPHAAVSGVAIVTGSLGPAVGTAALVAEWSLGRVQRVTLQATASGYVGTVEPFVAGIGAPVAVATAPDGAVLVGDWSTGTIYRIARA